MWHALILTKQPEDIVDVLILSKFVATIVAKAVLDAVILDKLPSECSDERFKSALGLSGELNSISLRSQQ